MPLLTARLGGLKRRVSGCPVATDTDYLGVCQMGPWSDMSHCMWGKDALSIKATKPSKGAKAAPFVQYNMYTGGFG